VLFSHLSLEIYENKKYWWKKKKNRYNKKGKYGYDKYGIFYLVINDRKIFYYKLINIIKHHLQIKYPLRNGWIDDKYIILKNPQIIASGS